MSSPFTSALRELAATAERVAIELGPEMDRALEMVKSTVRAGGTLFFCGNGGSAADASHLATEFVCRFKHDRRPYPAIALGDAGSTLLAIGNDYSFDQVFARQVRAFGQKGDVLVAFTTSGNSRNIHLALEAAREIGIQSIAFLGKGGGESKGLATVDLLVPATETIRVQEAHLLLYHAMCEAIEPLIGEG